MLPVIAWKVLSINPSVASVRYRCLLPMLGLQEVGLRSTLFQEGEKLLDERVAAMVFVKSFTDADIALARRIQGKVPIFLDLCDNVFIERYAANAPVNPVRWFQEISYLASAIVVPTEELARRVRQRAPTGARIEVIPDQVETPGQCKYLADSTKDDPLLNRQLVCPLPSRDARHPLERLEQFMRRLIGNTRASAIPAARQVSTQPTGNDLKHFEIAKPPNGRKKLIWFGTHGADYSEFGMGTIGETIPALIELSRRLPIELLVVSNNEEKFRALMRTLPFPALYRPWGMVTIFADLASADVCLLPNARDEFSICKSANRAVLALSMGVPVVATGIPSLAPLKECIIEDNWFEGLSTYLTDASRRARDLDKAAQVIAQYYSAKAISMQWLTLLSDFVSPSLLAQAANENRGNSSIGASVAG